MNNIVRILRSPKLWLFILFCISMVEYIWTLKINLYGVGINIIWGVTNIALLDMVIF